MSRIRLKIWVHAPKEKVFKILTDIESFPAIQPSIHSVELLTTGPTRVGTAWNLKRTILEKEVTVKFLAAELAVPDKLVYYSEASGISYKTSYTITDSSSGTLIEMEVEGSSLGFVASLTDKITSTSLKDWLEDDLARIKLAAEGTPPSTEELSDQPDLPAP